MTTNPFRTSYRVGELKDYLEHHPDLLGDAWNYTTSHSAAIAMVHDAYQQNFKTDGSGNAAQSATPKNPATFGLPGQRNLLMMSAVTNPGVAATGTLTSDATNVANADTVTIGSKVYTFQTSLTNVDGNVHIGASAAASLTNLFNAINNNGGGVSGTDYAAAMTTNADVSATNPTATTVVLTAKAVGTAANSKATTETSAHLSFGAATLAGGVAADTVSFATTYLKKSDDSSTPSSVILAAVGDWAMIEHRGDHWIILAAKSGVVT